MKTNREQKIYNITIAGSIVNMLLLASKFAAGIIGNSAAMIADAIHSLSDFVTDIVVIVLVKLSSKPADHSHNYGHGKYETIATSIIGMALIAVGIKLCWSNVERVVMHFGGDHTESPGSIALWAALMSIVLKEGIFRATRKVAKEVKSQALMANAWHHRSDALSSIGTGIGIGGAIVLGGEWTVLDPIASIVVSIMIIITATQLIRQATGELLEESLSQEIEKQIVEIVYQDTLASDVHNLHTRRIGSIIAIEMHLRLPGVISLEEAHEHATQIENSLRKEFGQATHIMLHVEPEKKMTDRHNKTKAHT